MGERVTGSHEVRGSNPLISTIDFESLSQQCGRDFCLDARLAICLVPPVLQKKFVHVF